jgi:hypothetical protein
VLIGHYSVAFVAKRSVPRAPLWLLALGVQLVDVLWGLFVLAGIEHIRLVPGQASNPLDLYDVPYTHSLLGTAGWAVLAGAGARAFGYGQATVVAFSVAVLSHWFLDLVVHRPDLTLLGSAPRLGLGLWDFPATAFGLEVALLGGSMWLCHRGSALRRPGRFFAVLVGIQAAATFGPTPLSVPSLALSVLGLYGAVTWAVARLET